MCNIGCKHNDEDDITQTEIQKHDFERDKIKDNIWSRITNIQVFDRKWPCFTEKSPKNSLENGVSYAPFSSKTTEINQIQNGRLRGMKMDGPFKTFPQDRTLLFEKSMQY